MNSTEGDTWKELNMENSKAIHNYCGGVKNDDLLIQGIDLLKSYREEIVPQLYCNNPHELMRTHEVLDILDVSEMILQACLMRKSSSKQLCFYRSDIRRWIRKKTTASSRSARKMAFRYGEPFRVIISVI